MYIATVPNRNSPPAVLLRESSRTDGKVVKRTLANLSSWSVAQIEALRRLLKGESLVSPSDAFQIQRSAPHGHVAAALGTLRRLGLEPILSRSPSGERNLVVAMIIARILDIIRIPGRWAQTRSSSEESGTVYCPLYVTR